MTSEPSEIDLIPACVHPPGSDLDLMPAVVDLKTTEVILKGRRVDLEVADVDLNAAEVDLTSVDVDLEAACAELNAADVDLPTVDLDLNAPQAILRAAAVVRSVVWIVYEGSPADPAWLDDQPVQIDLIPLLPIAPPTVDSLYHNFEFDDNCARSVNLTDSLPGTTRLKKSSKPGITFCHLGGL